MWEGEYIPSKIGKQKQDNQKAVRVGDQKGKIVEITIGINFFLFSLFFFSGSFQVPFAKNLSPLKLPIPTQNPNLT